MSPLSTLVDRLAEELGRRWRSGERPVVEDYLALYPELSDRPEAAAELIYEELCLRQEHDRGVDAAEVLCRFPQWREQLRILMECHRFLEAGASSPVFPVPGERLGDFSLLAELGRGAHGRVFLATEPALADRPVVLKLVPRSGREHLSLARLQHTHIVPLYSVQEDPVRNLRTLCMPYFGGATLAELLEWLQAQPPERRTGRRLVEALRRAQAAAPIPVPVTGPVCQFLTQVSYTRAVCWMAACLADALQFTHERGLVHLDLKPSNVLWAADGQPMLLDLNLARGPIPAGAPAPAWLGGTPAYMAPEHRLALAAVRQGRSVPERVDGRADIYALGLLLCEALGGALLGPAAQPAGDGGAGRHPRPLPGGRPAPALPRRGHPGRRSASAPCRRAPARRRQPQPRRALAQMAPAPAVRGGPARPGAGCARRGGPGPGLRRPRSAQTSNGASTAPPEQPSSAA